MSWLSQRSLAFQATLHCLTGCAIGEILGMIIGIELGFGMWETIALAVTLAFVFGYALSIIPVLRSGVSLKKAMRLVLAADTLSITTMEIVDNAIMALIPGAMHRGFDDWLFWVSMAVALFVAFWAAYPVNRYLLSKGRGHALIHETHHAHHS